MRLKKSNKVLSISKHAWLSWIPHRKESIALAKRIHIDKLIRVDQMWDSIATSYGDVVAVNSPHAYKPERFTYKELALRISLAARAFKEAGIKEGDVVSLFAENSPRWLIADQGLMRLGACDAVRGANAPVEELKYILNDSKSVALIVQNKQLLDRLCLNDEQFNRLKVVISLEEGEGDNLIGWDKFLSDATLKPCLISGHEELAGLKNSVATILYTSGTTGQPKGVPLTHSNLLHQIRSLACIANPAPGSPVLSVLPIWHSYERSAEYYFFSCCCTQTYTSIKHLKHDLPIIRPVVMATVPRLWESIKDGFDDALLRMPKGRQSLIKLALKNSRYYKFALRRFKSLVIVDLQLTQRFSAFLEVVMRWPIHAFADTILWPKVLKQVCGGRLRFPISGGGAIAPHVDSFFESLGIELLVGYGLTETSPVLSCRRPWRNIRGTAGQPLPQTEFKIVDIENKSLKELGQKGLVMVRGPQVMAGYLGKQKETNKVLDSNGWFNTGDLGFLLEDGSLVLTGRAKDTIVLSSGENIEPGPLEEALVASPLISQVMLIGQDERMLAALVVPHKDNLLAWLNNQNISFDHEIENNFGGLEVRRLLRREINLLLSTRVGSRSEERVYGVALVDPFTIENGLLTQTLKQRRDKIIGRDIKAKSAIYGTSNMVG